MVGRWISFWGPAHLQLRTVSFRECTIHVVPSCLYFAWTLKTPGLTLTTAAVIQVWMDGTLPRGRSSVSQKNNWNHRDRVEKKVPHPVINVDSFLGDIRHVQLELYMQLQTLYNLQFVYIRTVYTYIDYGSLVRTLIFTFLVKHRVFAG